MPIPFRDNEDLRAIGSAAYMRFEAARESDAVTYGALFFTNARGEPLEYVYNKVELIRDTLWRPVDRRHAGMRRLAVSLFEAARLVPALVLCEMDDEEPTLFGPDGHLDVSVPVVWVPEFGEVVWRPAEPTGQARDLFALLEARDLLHEPFRRAASGLRVAYEELLEPTDG